MNDAVPGVPASCTSSSPHSSIIDGISVGVPELVLPRLVDAHAGGCDFEQTGAHQGLHVCGRCCSTPRRQP